MTTYYNIPDSAWLFRDQLGRRRTEDAKWTPAEESVRQGCIHEPIWKYSAQVDCLDVERFVKIARERKRNRAGIDTLHRLLALLCPEDDRTRYTITPAARKELLTRLLAENHHRATKQAPATKQPKSPKPKSPSIIKEPTPPTVTTSNSTFNIHIIALN